MRRTIWTFYGFQFFFSLLFWLPIFYEYQKQIGLTDSDIFAIQSLYYIAFCLLEIPTGILADRFGHRRCLIAGATLLVFSNALPIFMQSYTGFLWHFLTIALSRSLISGASSAYIYDYLHQFSAVEVYKEIEGNARSYSLIGKVACWAVVGPLMQWHLTLPYWLTVGAALVSIAMALALPSFHENRTAAASSVGADGWWLRVRAIGRQIMRQPILGFLMLQGVAVFVLARICQINLFQPILESKSFPVASYGLVMSVMTIFEAAGAFRPTWFRRFMSDLNAVYFLTFVMAISMMILPLSGQIGVIAGLCIFSYATGLSFPIQRQLMNDAIEDGSYRATILSVESIVDRAANAGLAAIIGPALMAGRLSEFLIWTGGGALLLTALLVLLGFKVIPIGRVK
jgi:MFS family permease